LGKTVFEGDEFGFEWMTMTVFVIGVMTPDVTPIGFTGVLVKRVSVETPVNREHEYQSSPSEALVTQLPSQRFVARAAAVKSERP
jgi:hypothetical protein